MTGCKYNIPESRSGNTKTIYIEAVKNFSLAPQIGPLVRHKLHEHILRRGHYEIVSNKTEGDYILKVSLKNYKKSSEIYNPQDTIIAAGFRLNINAIVTFSSRSGTILIDEAVVSENASVVRKNPLTKPMDRQALLSLSESLGSQISQLTENFKW